ncbi:hypothetical protein [Halorussus salinus]|uniref:hypothetical protein n=1 Tax=Halorussus salinus TaxID=1364935 RepID=UPI00138F2641|nr:hypothetical protein [Halorussus salinus]
MDQFRKERRELALVTDDETVVGMVTPTDAFETTGELEDPFDDGRAPDATA